MITKAQAESLGTFGRGELHYGPCTITVGPRGGTREKREVWRVNGACKTWKTRPEDFRLPIKYGIRGPYWYVTQDNAADFHLVEDCQPTYLHQQ